MTCFVSVQVVIDDADIFDSYRAKASAALARHGGKPIAGGPAAEVLEDNGAGPKTTVLLSFPSADAARDWINDPDFAETHALRRKGARTMITLLPLME